MAIDIPPPPADYEVGYGRPPKDTQFKSGHPGHPRRKRQSAKSLYHELMEVLGQLTTYKDGRKRRKTTTSKLLLLSMVRAALAGDHRARRDLINLLRNPPKHAIVRPELPTITSDMTDKEAVEALAAIIKADKL